MKKITMYVLMLCLGTITVMNPANVAAEDNSINIGVVGLFGADTTASIPFVEYERLLGNGIALFGRLGTLDYSYDDGSYIEDGDGPGIDFGIRKYMGGVEMKGFYLGGTIGIWTTDWTYTDTGYGASSPYYSGNGESTALKLDLELGGRIPLGDSPLSIMPSFHLGNFLSIDESCTSTSVPGADCGAESELGIYAVVGCSVGIEF